MYSQLIANVSKETLLFVHGESQMRACALLGTSLVLMAGRGSGSSEGKQVGK
jgi:hypothetical protein